MSSPMSSRRLTRSAALVAATMSAALCGLPATAAQAAEAPACTPVQLVVARGTTEPGPLGVIVGDQVAPALQGRFAPGRVSAVPVDYPASFDPGSLRAGVTALVAHLEAQSLACPEQRFVLSGYSQGSMVVNFALDVPALRWVRPVFPVVSSRVQRRIRAVLLFGNPLWKTGTTTGAYAGRTRDSCLVGDPVCRPADPANDINDHYRYIISEATAGAEYAADRLEARCRAIPGAAWCQELLAP